MKSTEFERFLERVLVPQESWAPFRTRRSGARKCFVDVDPLDFRAGVLVVTVSEHSGVLGFGDHPVHVPVRSGAVGFEELCGRFDTIDEFSADPVELVFGGVTLRVMPELALAIGSVLNVFHFEVIYLDLKERLLVEAENDDRLDEYLSQTQTFASEVKAQRHA